MQEPKFSILVANYNNSKFLDDLFLSFKEQSFKNYEVVFVDDYSNDNSLEIANNYALNDNRIRIYKNSKNLGCGKNKAKCIELAKGEICGFVDPDDILEPNALEVMINNFETNPDTALVYSNFYLCNEDLSKIEKYNYDSNIPKDKVLIYGATPNHFSAFKKENYLKTSGINPNFKRAIDRDMVLKLEETGKTIHIPDYLYKYRINSNSISNNQNAFKAEYWA
ncbi:MAG: glycosyltransferase [Bacteroidales bacterium]|nr:glycosyltransferase [Bacteroidales bacterium]